MYTVPFAKFLGASRGLDRSEFVERYRVPALIVEPTTDPASKDLEAGNTPFAHPNWWRPTPSHPGTGMGDRAGQYPFLERAVVVWLEKSPRNPFESLITLGRAPNNDVRFSLESVSKLHVTFNRSGDRWYVQDHLSKNGTFVNGERLAAGQLRLLASGDSIKFAPELKARFFAPDALYDFALIVQRMSGSPAPEAAPTAE